MKSKTQSSDFKIPKGAPPKKSKPTERPPNPPKPLWRGGFRGGHSGSGSGRRGSKFPPLEEPPEVNTDVSLPLPLSQSNLPVGARLGHFVGSWEKITENQWVLSVIKRGYRIPFISMPPLSPTDILLSIKHLGSERRGPVDKGAVEHIKPEVPGFYSRIFLVLNKNRKLRLIIDLSILYTFVDLQGFKMETQVKVRQAIQTSDCSFSLVLTDAYLHVPMHRASRKYLQFCIQDQVFQFRALPFGLTASPSVFTKLMTAIAIHLRKRAITLFPYLDDWLVRNQSRLILLRDR